MATVKIKFRPSTVDGKQGVIYYQVTHKRVVRVQKTDYYLYRYEWNALSSEVIIHPSDSSRKLYLLDICNRIRSDMHRFKKIIASFDYSMDNYMADDVIKKFVGYDCPNYFFVFMEEIIDNLKNLGKIRTSETYKSTLNSFKRFRQGVDLSMDDIDSDMMMQYEAYLKSIEVSSNSSSFYMRNLRAVYNRAVEKELIAQRYPFKHVYTGVDKTIKRAISLQTVKKIKMMDLSKTPVLDFARDMFLFSFYTRGMSFVDMAYLQKKDLKAGILSYCRRKTGQRLCIRWEKCMREIVDKYNTSYSCYLLPIIKPYNNIEERKQYIYAAHNINRNLKIIGKRLGLSVPLTMYVARHAWASIAKSKNVPLSVISEGMGHDSESTTRIYLASLDTVAIDRANRMILKFL